MMQPEERGMAASITASSRDLPISAPTPYFDPLPHRVLGWCTFAMATAIVAVLVAFDPRSVAEHAAILAPWTLLVSVADLLAIEFWQGVYLGLSLPLLLAAAFLFGPAASGLMALVGSFEPRELKRQVSLPGALFNHGQVCLSVIAAAYVFQVIGVRVSEWPLVAAPALLSLLADAVVNLTLVVFGSSLRLGVSRKQVLVNMLWGSALESAVTYAAFGLLAILLAAAYLYLHVWGLAVAVLPLLLARQLFLHGRQLLLNREQLDASREALQVATQRIVEERSDERARIADALHDDVLQGLYNVTLHAEVIREELKSGRLLALEDDIPRLIEASQRTRVLLRDVIKGLRRSEFGVGGVGSTLRLLVEELSANGRCQIDAAIEDVGGAPSSQLLIYQIAREALKNAVQHSRASRIAIQLARDGELITLMVEDDGQGFVLGDVDPEEHFGIQMMLERAELANGRLTVRSQVGHGTQILGVFPYEDDPRRVRFAPKRAQANEEAE